MPSLRELLAAHDPVLLVDAASARVQCGILTGSDGSGRWTESEEEAGTGIFRCIEDLDVDLGGVAAFAFCEGPGSVLGIRTAAMALRIWQTLASRPVFAYRSLALVAEDLGRDDVSVIADARRDSWHRCKRGGPLERISTSALSGSLVMPEGFRHWTALPAGVERVPYRLAELLPRIAGAGLFQATEAPDAFLHEEPSYALWTRHIHRAP